LPLETATYLTDLVTSNPAHTDGLSQADSHMRLLKSTIKATFPNFTSGAVQSTQAQIDAACTGLSPSRFFAGTAALPGFTPVGSPSTGFWSPAANQVALSISGVQALLMGGTAIVSTMSITTTSGVAAAAIASVGAYSGGTGQLVPIGSTLLWWDDVLPTEGGYAWANGQIIASANTVCPILLARWGTRFGGNGTTTMGVPDLRDTVPVGKSTMGAVASRALQTLTNTVLGTLFGEANHILTVAELASHYHAVGISDPGHTHSSNAAVNSGGSTTPGGAFAINPTGAATINAAVTGIRASSSNGIDTSYSQGSGTAHNNVQPSTTCNYIIRLA
jgi:microcystin-dependent protein